jgi:hypothetical protein
MTTAVLNALLKPLLEPHLPDWLTLRWYANKAEAFFYAPEAEIGWFDMHSREDMAECFRLATKMKWLNPAHDWRG